MRASKMAGLGLSGSVQGHWGSDERWGRIPSYRFPSLVLGREDEKAGCKVELVLQSQATPLPSHLPGLFSVSLWLPSLLTDSGALAPVVNLARLWLKQEEFLGICVRDTPFYTFWWRVLPWGQDGGRLTVYQQPPPDMLIRSRHIIIHKSHNNLMRYLPLLSPTTPETWRVLKTRIWTQLCLAPDSVLFLTTLSEESQ